jgi:hypothetical protein
MGLQNSFCFSLVLASRVFTLTHWSPNYICVPFKILSMSHVNQIPFPLQGDIKIVFVFIYIYIYNIYFKFIKFKVEVCGRNNCTF